MDNLDKAIERLEIIRRKDVIIERLAKKNGLDLAKFNAVRRGLEENRIIDNAYDVNNCLKELTILKHKFGYHVRYVTDEEGCLEQEDDPGKYSHLYQIWREDFNIEEIIKDEFEKVKSELEFKEREIELKKEGVSKVFSDVEELAKKAEDWTLDESMSPNLGIYLGGGVRYKPPKQRKTEYSSWINESTEQKDFDKNKEVEGVTVEQWVEVINPAFKW